MKNALTPQKRMKKIKMGLGVVEMALNFKDSLHNFPLVQIHVIFYLDY